MAAGTVAAEVLIFFAAATNRIRAGLVLAFFLALLIGFTEFVQVFKRCSMEVKKLAQGSLSEKLLATFVLLLSAIEFLAAMAPLTASDALHYHFAAQQHIVHYGFHPDFFLTHSFLCGQGHLLILLGLALGSERLAMSLVFLGGMLSALAAACLARRWMTREWSWGVAILFLVTPLVFWQIAGAGAPDIWMAFFLVASVLVISRCREMSGPQPAMVAGMLAGGIAGTKYIGCVFAAALLAALVLEARSFRKAAAFVASTLVAGIWPYLRNLIWTGDPVFPFLTPRLFPNRVNSYGLADLLATTGGTSSHSLSQALQFPLFAWIDPQRLGFWQFFGPLILALAPLLFVAVRNTALWRTVIVVWMVSTFGVAFSSGMMRYVLPVFPVALAAVLAGVAALEGKPLARQTLRVLDSASHAST